MAPVPPFWDICQWQNLPGNLNTWPNTSSKRFFLLPFLQPKKNVQKSMLLRRCCPLIFILYLGDAKILLILSSLLRQSRDRKTTWIFTFENVRRIFSNSARPSSLVTPVRRISRLSYHLATDMINCLLLWLAGCRKKNTELKNARLIETTIFHKLLQLYYHLLFFFWLRLSSFHDRQVKRKTTNLQLAQCPS